MSIHGEPPKMPGISFVIELYKQIHLPPTYKFPLKL